MAVSRSTMQRLVFFVEKLQALVEKMLVIHHFFLIFVPMKERALILSTLLSLALCTTAQAQDVKSAIRQHYAEAKAYIEQIKQLEAEGDIYPVPQVFSVQVKQNLPATGYHEEDIKMYYREEQDSDEQIYPDLFLNFATKQYNFAARTFYEEYLYDKQGRLAFFYGSTPDIDEAMTYEHELRFYFDKGQLIEVLLKRRPIEGGTFTTIYQGKSLPKAYKGYYESRLSASKDIMQTFKAINAGREL